MAAEKANISAGQLPIDGNEPLNKAIPMSGEDLVLTSSFDLKNKTIGASPGKAATTERVTALWKG